MENYAVHVEGARELRRTLKRAGDNMQDLKKANYAAGMHVATASKPRSPRRTGALAGTLRAARAQGRASVNLGRAAVPYAGPIHWGWPRRNITAQPFVAETAQSTQGSWLRIYEQDIRRELDKVRGA